MQFGFKCVKPRISLSEKVPFNRVTNYISYTLLNITFQRSERHNSNAAVSVICHYTSFPLSRRDKEEDPWVISLTRATSGTSEGENVQRHSVVYLTTTAQQ
jgi:hypothetical protein